MISIIIETKEGFAGVILACLFFLQPLIYFKWIWQLVAYYLILSNIADW